MICPRCLLLARSSAPRSHLQHATRLLPQTTPKLLAPTSARRAYAAKPISVNAATQSAPRQGSPDSPKQPPAATSTSAAQPFSTPLTPSPANAGVVAPRGKGAATPPAIALSSVPAGTVLKGLNFLKNQTDPVALEDGEYPSWLWDLLRSDKGGAKDKDGEGDLYAKSKKQRRVAAKRMRKMAALQKNQPPKVPVYEQSVDMPAGDGTVRGAVAAEDAREGLTKAMRKKRRADIKESNFLKAMG